jgi:hypothetical protein
MRAAHGVLPARGCRKKGQQAEPQLLISSPHTELLLLLLLLTQAQVN